MSEYDNVVAVKLRLKGKAFDVKSGRVTKKKKHKKHHEQLFNANNSSTDLTNEDRSVNADNGEQTGGYDDRLTPAEKRYLEQWQRLEMQRLAKNASKSHRDRIQEFNQYLANLTEHYDIPKVGPG